MTAATQLRFWKSDTPADMDCAPPPCSDSFARLMQRAEKLQSLAVDAYRFEKWSVYKWLIREYRRKWMDWDALAKKEQIPVEKRCMEWDVTCSDYAFYLDRCRETFGLPPLMTKLKDLPGAEDRRETLISDRDQELEDARAKYDPYYLNEKADR